LIGILPLLFGSMFLIMISGGCERLDPERKLIIKTRLVSDITYNSCLVIGEIIDFRQESASQHGFCYSTTKDPTIEDELVLLGSINEQETFSDNLTGLSPGVSYYVKAYATDNRGTTYGDELEFITSETPMLTVPSLTTKDLTSVTENSASSGGDITNDGGAAVLQKGVCFGTSQNPTIFDFRTTDGSGSESYTSLIDGLNCNTIYYVRAYATNSEGTGYGQELSFTTGECTASLPTVTTLLVSGITENSAQGGGNVTDDGGASVIVKGICWSTSSNPTLSDSHTEDGSGTGTFSSSLTELSCETTYYVRAYARNASGTAYGAQVEFTTTTCSASLPTLSTTAVTGIGETVAQSGGNITDDGGASVTVRGVCWSISQDPTLSDPHTEDGSGTGIFSSSLTGLTAGVTYYVKAYATNASGTAYGDQVLFTTNSPTPPTVSTSVVTDITESTANSGGNVSDEGSYPVTSRGICWSTLSGPTLSDHTTVDGTGPGIFTSLMDGLDCNTKYYVRAYATSGAGTSFGDELSFTTGACPPGVPIVTTANVNNITETTAQGGGDVTEDGGAAVTVKGICWSTSPTPTIANSYTTDGSGTGSFVSELSGLNANTTYYVRAYGTNSIGTGYGNEVSFNTNSEIVTDYDGNEYPVVVIGNQTWMGENLRVTHYSDGTAIPLVENNTLWDNLSDNDDAYCWNGNNATTGATYGALYTWAAAMNDQGSSDTNPSGVQGVCPTSWHLPSDSEWKELEMHLGMDQAQADAEGWRGSTEGGELKESGTNHWNPPNTGASDDSKFTALPGGNRYDYGTFNNVGNTAFFWSAVGVSSSNAMGRSLSYNIEKVYRSNYAKSNGFSVRCIRDD